MDSYIIQVSCNHCGASWSEKVRVTPEEAPNKVLSFISEIINQHWHETKGYMMVTWDTE